MKIIKLSKKKMHWLVVTGKWRRLIRGIVEHSDDSGDYCVWYQLNCVILN